MKQEGHTFEVDQVTFWDEIHIKQKCGTENHSTLIFARNDDGIYDDPVLGISLPILNFGPQFLRICVTYLGTIVESVSDSVMLTYIGFLL